MPTWTTLASGQACGSASCPAVHLSEDGRLFIQGRRASDDVRAALALRAEEDAVEIPRDLLEQALESLRRPGDEH